MTTNKELHVALRRASSELAETYNNLNKEELEIKICNILNAIKNLADAGFLDLDNLFKEAEKKIKKKNARGSTSDN